MAAKQQTASLSESLQKRAKLDSASDVNRARSKPLPVTLLSGFLGSGKTTLLEHILASPDHGLRIAVIVNDMSKLNIDAKLIEKHSVASSHEKLIKLQNGCICCTLRGDLLEELVSLAKDGKVEYVVIESTGISEPEQVAETFTAELANALLAGDGSDGENGMDEAEIRILREVAAMGGLNSLAYLDTCVTVLDAYNLFSNLHTADFLSDRWDKDEKIEPEDERTISDLLIDQIDLANVILVNKIDQVSAEQKQRIHEICAILNPNAKVIETLYSKVDVKEVVNTGSYDYEKAKMGSGWLKSLHELSLRNVGGKMRMAPKPETEEYGISSFVYQARRPFHPKRLFELVHDKFILLQNTEQYEDESEGGDAEEGAADDIADEEGQRDIEDISDSDPDEEGREDSPHSTCSTDLTDDCSETPTSDATRSTEHSDGEKNEVADKDFSKDIPVAEILNNKANHNVFKTLYRSKGFWWHATRPTQHGEWSQAGGILTTTGGSPWFCCIPKDEWPEDKEVLDLIQADFQEPWDDRRQEIVFIGEKLDVDGVTKIFDACLLNDREMKKWEKAMTKGREMEPADLERVLEGLFEDGWEDWPTTPLMGGDDGDHAGHHHH